MRPLAALLFALAAHPLLAADKDEDKAKEAAVAFLKAVKAKNADAVMKTVAAPFAYKNGDDVAVLKDEDAVKKWVMERLEEIKDSDKVPTELNAIHAFADVRDRITNEEHRKKVEEILGKGGFIAVVKTSDEKMIPILVRVKDGKAKVVGIGR